VARLDATAAFMEMWFDSELRSASSPEEKLQEITTSGYFGVAFEEQALLRTALEARVVADVFPECSPELGAIRARLEALRDRAHGELEGLFQKRADEAWAAVLASPT
jgi:hypothetical protein